MVQKAGYQRNLLNTAVAGALGSFSFGYNLGSLNSIEIEMQKCSREVEWDKIILSKECFKVSELTWGYVASMICLGALMGCVIGGKLVDKIGRKGTIKWSNAFYIPGLLMLTLALNVSFLMVGRLLIGVGIGISCVAVPLFLTEISSWDVRGLVGSFHQAAIVIGYLISLIVGYFFTNLFHYSWSWRVILGLDLIPCMIQLWLLTCESPKYLYKDQAREGEATLKWLRGSGYDPQELYEFQKEPDPSMGFVEFLKLRPRGFTTIIMLHLGQQFSGINGILYFSTNLFKDGSPRIAPLVPIFIAVLNVIMTFVALGFIDKTGRRPLLLISSFGMTVGSGVFIISLLANNFALKVVSVLGFVALFAVGMGPVPWLLLGELFPQNQVGAGVTLGVTVNWLCNFAVVAIFPNLVKSLKDFFLLPFLIFLSIFTVWAWLELPETKGGSSKSNPP